MYKGKSTCQQLKKIRREIAEANHIPWEDSECHYEGDCAGTCPKCDAEVRFLENTLRKSKQLGKVVTLSGAALAFSACGNQTQVKTNMETTADNIAVVYENCSDTEAVDSSSSILTKYPDSIVTTELVSDVGLIIDTSDEWFEEGEIIEIKEETKEDVGE